MPSSPAMAPDGAYRRQPVARARSITSGCSSNAPMLMTIRSFPSTKGCSAKDGTTCPPAVSTSSEDRSTSSGSSRYGGGPSSVSRYSSARCAGAAGHAGNVHAESPASAARSSARPMAPQPTTPRPGSCLNLRETHAPSIKEKSHSNRSGSVLWASRFLAADGAEAVAAVHRPVAAGDEGHHRVHATLVADHRVHLTGAAAAHAAADALLALASTAARRAPLRVIGVTAGREKFLLTLR